MLIQPGRIYAATIEEAVKEIRDKYGPGDLTIYKALVQPRPGLFWWEFYIEVVDDHETPQTPKKVGEQDNATDR